MDLEKTLSMAKIDELSELSKKMSLSEQFEWVKKNIKNV